MPPSLRCVRPTAGKAFSPFSKTICEIAALHSRPLSVSGSVSVSVFPPSFSRFQFAAFVFVIRILIPVSVQKARKVGAAAVAPKSPALCRKGNAVWTHRWKNSRPVAFRFSVSRAKTPGTNFGNCFALRRPVSSNFQDNFI